ncbi:MAG TPA: 16S rRNA (cytosine(1402)-N(4))-methyltransferase RsmH [Kiloniellaceae bacterium]|nr:16S rRNA (cytosine(1402)-N(4))-methyltransferase RsmH [Kiloniellaceae bacterium]
MTHRPPQNPANAGPAADSRHVPVMCAEVLEALAPRDGAVYVDGTFGAGGYSRAILDAADCRVVAIDRDRNAIAAGQDLVRRYDPRLTLVEGRFSAMSSLLPPVCTAGVDGIALDLGVSSMQLDEAERGFSFSADGPLDMRMEGAESRDRASAAEVVMSRSEEELSDILFHYGEERKARQIARAIVAARRVAPIERTAQLADIVRRVLRRGGKRTPGESDPATRSFQALRIYVNDELEELHLGLEAAERLLAPKGRLAVVSFHSLEDRIVKTFLQDRSGGSPRASRHAPQSLSPCQLDGEGRSATFTVLFRGARRPGDEEIRVNPRARSARLRAAERTTAPAAEARPDGRDGPAGPRRRHKRGRP